MRLYVSNRNSEDRRIALVSESHALIFQAITDFDTRTKSCSLTLVSREELKNQGYKRLTYREIFGFIGLIEVDNNIFIGTITGASKVASPIPGESVNKIYAVDFHCLTDSRWDFIDLDSQGRPLDQQFNNHDSESDNDGYKTNIEGYDLDRSVYSNSIPLQQHPCYQYKKLLSNGSFYYSADFDITSILQDRGLINSKKKHVDNEKDTDNISSTECCREEFMWNNFMLREIMFI